MLIAKAVDARTMVEQTDGCPKDKQVASNYRLTTENIDERLLNFDIVASRDDHKSTSCWNCVCSIDDLGNGQCRVLLNGSIAFYLDKGAHPSIRHMSTFLNEPFFICTLNFNNFILNFTQIVPRIYINRKFLVSGICHLMPPNTFHLGQRQQRHSTNTQQTGFCFHSDRKEPVIVLCTYRCELFYWVRRLQKPARGRHQICQRNDIGPPSGACPRGTCRCGNPRSFIRWLLRWLCHHRMYGMEPFCG